MFHIFLSKVFYTVYFTGQSRDVQNTLFSRKMKISLKAKKLSLKIFPAFKIIAKISFIDVKPFFHMKGDRKTNKLMGEKNQHQLLQVVLLIICLLP